jgi:hypothetical protein
MTVQDLIRLMQNQLATLNGMLATATVQGDVARMTALDTQIAQTQTTLDQLRSLP